MTRGLDRLADQQRALHARVIGAASDEAAPALLRPSGHLAVYQNAYRARLASALRDNHSVLHRALGDEAFDALAQAYIEAQPSRQASIRWFGDQLAPFMAARPDLVPHAALIDIARMDWALRTAFDAADAAPLRLQDLGALAPPDWLALSFRWHPSVQLLALDWAIEPVWHVLQRHDPASGEEAPPMPAPQALTHHLLVWRQGLETRWRSVDTQEAWALGAVSAGTRFGELCGGLAEAAGDEAQAAAMAAGLLGQWLMEGLLVGRSPGPG
jgi:hypothetical protein